MKLNGTSIVIILAGGAFAYSGLKGQKLTSTIQGFLRDGNPTTGTDSALSLDASTEAGGAAIGAGAETLVPTATGGTASTNQAIARLLATPYGWSAGNEWDSLVKLWQQESSWSNTAMNGSGAYGIAQALPSTKYPKAGQPPSQGGSSSASAQISWGLQYIKGRYGSPSVAWTHEQSVSWY